MQTRLTINGTSVTRDIAPAMLLVDVLRDELGMTGTHIGCDTSQCGACNVLVDGKAVKSCTMLAVQAEGAVITTIEGLASGDATAVDSLHPMQAAFREHHGLQCGFCTPGMVMAGLEIVRRHGPGVDAATIAHELEGNLCRCTGYINIIKAIEAGARAMGAAASKGSTANA
jgi:carbon-monoxide dehydrogenase small subunit